jgi:hypothetical protein
MRKSVQLILLLCLAAGLAAAQGKVSSAWDCSKPSDTHSINVGDKANHAYAISQFKCTASKGELAGVKDKEGTGTEFDDVSGMGSKGHGIFVETMANGDQIHYTFTNTASMAKDGSMQSGSNKWQMTGGTGKFKGISGNGSCKGKGSADGSSHWDCSGTYTKGK